MGGNQGYLNLAKFRTIQEVRGRQGGSARIIELVFGRALAVLELGQGEGEFRT